MKPLLVFVTLLAAGTVAMGGDAQREVSKKEVVERFGSTEEATGWRPGHLPMEKWLDLVTPPGARLLDSGETDDAYFAVFRLEQCLVFWYTLRRPSSTTPSGQTSTEVVAKDDGRVIWERPSKWASLEYRLETPGGAITARDQGLAFQIKADFQGELVLNYRKDDGKKGSRTVLRREVMWSK